MTLATLHITYTMTLHAAMTIEHFGAASCGEWTLKPDTVHVWWATLDQPAAYVDQLISTLSDDERARAARFPNERRLRSFVVARGMLREMVGQYVGTAPAAVQFAYGMHGKPRLVAPAGAETLEFNLAHTHGLVVYAFTRGRCVGVDVERMRTLANAEQLARRFFSRQEHAALTTLPAEERHAAFWACWTRKEAYIKARGNGLAMLRQFSVELASADGQHSLWAEDADRWSLYAFTPTADYVAALVAEAPVADVICRAWAHA
jgi:4'-phosphopantetheinyl transferase